ncbi:trypsin-like peptidase domain-containing protein [Thalassotalea sediminis]|uniref:trypsin-like peptidase domain-containing protein n=1 Tax=Thalassotalea sediminis TaxID=1759089 RepID=UPI0025732EFF|nr:trypsin-like peptidase domain-containing protein [Thalassotalea sediminis]
MKLIDSVKYVLNAVSYGVIFAVVILVVYPELSGKGDNWWNIFRPQKTNPAPLSYANAVQRAGPAVVNLYSEEIQNSVNYLQAPRSVSRLGSGVIMDPNGYMLTNYHVVQNAAQITVDLQNGQRFPATIIGYDIYTDLAVLKIEASNLPVIPQNLDLTVSAGDVVLAIGNPLNLGQTITQGIISATGRTGLSSTNHTQFLQMDAAINEGNSGGALVNTNGTLVGINSRLFREINPQLDIQGIFFAIPYQLAYKVMQQIIENGRVIRGWLGIDTQVFSQNPRGFVISGIIKNSPAHVAQLKPGDIVSQIGDTPITSTIQALDLVAETRPGTEVMFSVYRGNKLLNIPVTILESKQ